MNRKELTDYIFNFWYEWGAFNYDERTDDEIKTEIYNNLGNKKDIYNELEYISNEIESGWDEDSLEYKNLIELMKHINDYKLKEYDENE